jgi:hypothetical protein
MIIKTINPITISGKRISKPSEYLSANGDADDFYGFDANGKPQNKEEVKQFQTWLIAKGVDISFKDKNGKIYSGKDAIDGDMKDGNKTGKAWNTYGAEFAKTLGGTTPTGTTPTAEPTKEEQIEQAKKGKIWDKAKGWITSDKAKDVLKSLLEGGGFMGVINALFGAGSTSGDANTSGTTTTDTTLPPKPGMSRNLKIGIAIGAIALLGIIIYSATRPKATN